jgi:hypothetical protein
LLVNVDFSRPGIPRSGERHLPIVSRANGIHAVPERKLENSSSQAFDAHDKSGSAAYKLLHSRKEK